MRRLVVTLTLAAVALPVAGCSDSEPVAMPDLVGKRLDVAKSDLERAGLDDDPEVVGGGVFGVIDESNWTVCSQDPASGTVTSEKPRLVVDRTCDTGADSGAGGDAPTEAASPTQAATTDAAPPTPTESPLPEILTAKNNKDLKAILAEEDNCAKSIATFAKRYSGKKIEFDGNVAAMAPHGTYDTRFDFLIGAEDFEPDSAVGPTFKIEDANFYDLNVTGGDTVRLGTNIHLVAEVGKYNPDTCLYFVEPESTKIRR